MGNLKAVGNGVRGDPKVLGDGMRNPKTPKLWGMGDPRAMGMGMG